MKMNTAGLLVVGSISIGWSFAATHSATSLAMIYDNVVVLPVVLA
jgi:hypothetical protein